MKADLDFGKGQREVGTKSKGLKIELKGKVLKKFIEEGGEGGGGGSKKVKGFHKTVTVGLNGIS